MTSIIEINGDDGTSLGNYKVPPEGKPVPEVLDNIFKKHGLDGVLVEDDSTDITKSDLVTAGHTYTFRPSINLPPPAMQVSLEQGCRIEKTMGEIQVQLERFNTAMAAKKSIRISDASPTVLRDVQSTAGVTVFHAKVLFDATRHVERIVPEFHWGESKESAQAERYVSHIWQEIVKLNANWAVINGNKYPTLLDNDLAGIKFRGTVDVAVVEEGARSLPATGLKVIFELKKVNKINGKAKCQTILSLLLANAVCDHYRPAAMLTDLGDKWIIFWMDGFSVYRYEFATRSKAVGFLDAILEGDGEPVDHSHALSRIGESSSRGVKRSFSGQQRFQPPEMERLEELAGCLPEDELWQGRAAIALKYALKIPGLNFELSDMLQSSKPTFEGMYF